MTVWKFNTQDGGQAFGAPADIWVAGHSLQFVVQFDPPAVVHWPTGYVVCPITEQHYGYPSDRARAAVREHIDANGSGAIWRAIEALPVINELPMVIS